MSPEYAALELAEIADKSNTTYIRCTPEIPDFTIDEPFQVVISGSKKRIAVDVNRDSIRQFIGLMQETVLRPGKIALTWNFKPLCSYHVHFVGKPFTLDCNLLDLKVLENYLGFFDQKQPENISEAIDRFKKVGNYKSWKTVYNKLHLPLILRTLPRLESSSIHHETDLTGKFAYYEIEGQRNGRLRSFGKFKRSYLPHTLGEEQKSVLRPKSFDDFFMLADINNCEVTVLQLLSGDLKIKEFIESGKDVYVQIYELLTGDLCDNEKKRSLCKLIFLPVIYGCGVRGLSENIGVNEPTSKDLIKRVHHFFKDSIEWITSKEKEAKNNGIVEDYFGRPRTFNEDNYYTSRNFVVQGPAATICLEKLIQIDDALEPIGSKVIFTVHDGYGITCKINKAKETWLAVKNTVRTESILFPGLCLDFHAQFGKKLNSLRTLWK